MKHFLNIIIIWGVLLGGIQPASACWFEAITGLPVYEEKFDESDYSFLPGEDAPPDFGPDRNWTETYVDENGATITIIGFVKDGYKQTRTTKEYIDPATGYRVVELDIHGEGTGNIPGLFRFYLGTEIRYQGSTKIYNTLGLLVYDREYGEGVSYKEWDYTYTHQNRLSLISDVIITFDDNGDVASITKVMTTTETITPVTIEPVIDPVTGEPVIDPVTGEPVTEPVLGEPVTEERITTETSNYTTDPETGVVTGMTESITEDGDENIVETATSESTKTTDPVTGTTTTITETEKKDGAGNVTGTVTETVTETANPETGVTTTETVTEKRDGAGNVTGTVTETVTETANPETGVTTTITETETRDGAGNVTGTVTETVSVCAICYATGNWTVCPNANLTCPVCGENIHGVFDHECPGVPEDPTVEDPGEDPPETGDPDPTPQPEIAKFYFSRVNQQAITKPVGTTYTIDLPMSVYVASTTGSAPGTTTIYLHCVPDEVTSGATYIPAVTSATVKSFTPPAPPLQLFGRSLYPNLTSSAGDDTWDSDDEFLLIISTDPDTADALTEVDNCCDGAGCRYHLRVKFSETTKPGR